MLSLDVLHDSHATANEVQAFLRYLLVQTIAQQLALMHHTAATSPNAPKAEVEQGEIAQATFQSAVKPHPILSEQPGAGANDSDQNADAHNNPTVDKAAQGQEKAPVLQPGSELKAALQPGATLTHSSAPTLKAGGAK
jgi:hypothetical protein